MTRDVCVCVSPSPAELVYLAMMRALAEAGDLSRVQQLLLDMLKYAEPLRVTASVRHYDCVVIAAGRARAASESVDEVGVLMAKNGVKRDAA